ncbi:Microtubule-binding protein involved in cell cycle control [Pseudoloma neurophilia]|uniref:Microtubule-binding protein involved in cell cycle control n=1 Tax=Pseudoloma neurophilia TaxID=146866 RepID=A0A0R0LSH4_9MICR|nr:Microtubule-binding protein involved in cell cycle control [Pseudoloma neurophilia]
MPLSKQQIIDYLFDHFKIKIKKIENLGNGIVFSFLLFILDGNFDIRRVFRVLRLKQIDFDDERPLCFSDRKEIAQTRLKTVDVFLNSVHITTDLLKMCQIALIDKIPFDIAKISNNSYFDNLEIIRYLLDEIEKIETVESQKNRNKRIKLKKNSVISTRIEERSPEKMCSTEQSLIDLQNELSKKPSYIKPGEQPGLVGKPSPQKNNKKTSIQKDSRIEQNILRSQLEVSEKRPSVTITREKDQKPVRSVTTPFKHDQCNKLIIKNESEPSDDINLNDKIIFLEQENMNLKTKMAKYDHFCHLLELERDFYYDKLIKIEKIVDSREYVKIKDILYEKLQKK